MPLLNQQPGFRAKTNNEIMKTCLCAHTLTQKCIRVSKISPLPQKFPGIGGLGEFADTYLKQTATDCNRLQHNGTHEVRGDDLERPFWGSRRALASIPTESRKKQELGNLICRGPSMSSLENILILFTAIFSWVGRANQQLNEKSSKKKRRDPVGLGSI